MKEVEPSDNLRKDTRWDGWSYSSEHFVRIVSRITFHHGVPEDVVKRFEVVKKLILHSYYEYEFLDLAFERALTTFEMALAMRYEHMTGKKRSPTFERLIAWGTERGLFDKSENFIQPLRKIRNMRMHPRQFSIAGFPASVEIVLRAVEVVNHMFPKVD